MTSVKWSAIGKKTLTAINEQKQRKSIECKIGKLMILIDFVHDFNIFFCLLFEKAQKFFF
jgi:hypothetical protein